MTLLSGDTVTQVLSSELAFANRERLVAHAIADLHFVDTFLKADYLSDNPQLVTRSGEIALSRHFELTPKFDHLDDSKYAGFTIKDAVESGGARQFIVYNHADNKAESKISLKYQELLPHAELVDFFSPPLNIPISKIATSESDTIYFVRSASAALSVMRTNAAQRRRFTNQAAHDREKMRRSLYL